MEHSLYAVCVLEATLLTQILAKGAKKLKMCISSENQKRHWQDLTLRKVDRHKSEPK